MGTMNTPVPIGLYAITDSQLTSSETLIASVEAAIRGGTVMVQYREKSASMAERLAQARNLQSVCASAQVPLLINDDAELAKRVGAAGVHLGQSDGSAAEARRLLGDNAIIGITCHADLTLAKKAVEAGADYLAFGRFFTSTTKPDAPAAATDTLAKAKRFNLPVTAIGGITTENGERLIRAGADLLAVVGGLFGGSPEDIEQKAKMFQRLFASHHPLFQYPDNRSTLK
ncbi:thiamine phosphate synthase [Marinobacter sp. 1_MG-2023]|uniref:thiamine phosphate synthase n=1 Tax=Marinobacter sp. 1_MG-2023 TaxID=3062627 RepID=UPI0026E1F5EC|nr:thiamine phosphate synthase [Marinobacter sp. 1_MG-2023]MDO6823990.1 thiamine phosphate synthase [Marinobacter sp. 1_MG-2023]